MDQLIATVNDTAQSMTDALARNRIVEAVAKANLRLGRLEDAMRGLQDAPNEATVLRQLAIDAANKNDADSVEIILLRLTDIDPDSATPAGRLASVLLAGGNLDGAMQIVRRFKQPFDGDLARYDFIVKLLELDRFSDAQSLTRIYDGGHAPRRPPAFKDKAIRDWAILAIMKRFAAVGRFTEAETFAQKFSSPEKRAWAFFEGSRLSPKVGVGFGETDRPESANEFLRRAGAILETLDVDKTNAEAVAIQRRIVGKALWNADERETARQLLESSEAALSIIEDSFRRLRAQCFLAKVLREIGELDSVRNYLNVSSLKEQSFTPIQRSELLQWLAEASGNADDWTLAVRETLDEKDETRRSRRIVEILRRFSYADEKTSPTDDPELDAVQLSGEEFEEQYYSPFAIEGCDC